MPLTPPPADLAGFPARRSAASLRTLYRVCWHRDRSGQVNTSPWRFSGLTGARSGRFDLAEPAGTCYWSSRRCGAWAEVFRGAKLVVSADAGTRRLWTGTAPKLRLAHLLSARSYLYGVTAAISTQPDFDLPQQWAAALHAEGFAGLVGSCSHDPSSTALNVAVFGLAADTSMQAGWTATSAPVATDPELLQELAGRGVRLAAVPYDVPTSSP